MNVQEKIYYLFFSEKTQEKTERFILYIALLSFIIHLILIYLSKFNLIDILTESDFLKNPISAIYTPFHLF